ncbi:cupin domain-containing protein [Caulobacter mirabilis]|uniref:ChrR-like cupin domain-containing protein n=1 Tax=Caulobacter mirabilis TaxID=69666 RepID=A0A2D2B250_9CAUL|nr:DUF4437 domain-containing protein [Caulobacter mirabilis]ATQ44286.1 hypothetical protein CSW64_18785 [Caulobacter mirabilis]
MDAATTAAPSRKIEIRRASQGGELMEAMSLAPVDMTQMEGLAKLVAADYQKGFVVKVLFSSAEPPMSLTYSWFKPGFPLPRHSHSADCLYYVISGEMRMGEDALGAGDCMFVPAGALYTFETGPQGVEFIEFRTAPKYDIRYASPAKAWERQLEQTRTHAAHWDDETPPMAVRRMTGEV